MSELGTLAKIILREHDNVDKAIRYAEHMAQSHADSRSLMAFEYLDAAKELKAWKQNVLGPSQRPHTPTDGELANTVCDATLAQEDRMTADVDMNERHDELITVQLEDSRTEHEQKKKRVVAWARTVYARPVNAPNAPESADETMVDIEFHNRPEKPEGEGWRPLVIGDET